MQLQVARLQQWLTYVGQCVTGDLSTDACQPAWKLLMLVCLLLAMVVVFVISYQLIRRQLEFIRNEKLVADRKKLADPEEMRKVQWAADRFADDISQEELAALIREHKAQTRTETS